MQLKRIKQALTVCRLASWQDIDLTRPFYFIGRTDEEISLVCPTDEAPQHTLACEDGWRAFRIQGVLDFSLVGVLSRISGILAGAGIGIFAVSTFNTDYILVKEGQFERALQLLAAQGYTIVE